jgi:uncharacterized delta-60 repeat protein
MSGSKTQTIRAGRRLLLVTCLLAFLLIPAAQATPGGLDPSFGTGGKVTTPIGAGNDAAYALALQPDGKIVAAGTGWTQTQEVFTLARYNPDGKLDPNFNGTGKVQTPIGSNFASVEGLVRQPDGKLVAAGSTYNGSDFDFALARYNPDGSLDTNFNGTGKVTTAIGAGNDFAYALALQPDGKIVAAGKSWSGAQFVITLARYNADGKLDPNFNGTGKVTTAIGLDDVAYAVAVQPDGKIVVAGDSYSAANSDDFTLARYNPDGKLDPSFNGTGKVTTAMSSGQDDANSLALQPDGKLVAAGASLDGSGNFRFALARYNPDGKLDPNFNGTGKVTTAIGSDVDSAHDLALQPDGKLVVAGFSFNGSRDVFALTRYNPNGGLDPNFGSGGKLTTSIGAAKDEANAIAIQPDGKLVAAGDTTTGINYTFALVRYLGSSLTVTKTGSGSGSVASSPSGVNCGATCSAPFAAVPVTLTATPAAGSLFVGWSGDCSGTGTCKLTMGGDHSVTARFETPKALTLTKAGSGAGTVTSSPGGISCGSSCAHAFTYGTSVTLTATAAAGSSFAGWSGGGCSGTGACKVTLYASKSVSAVFQSNKTLAVTEKGTGKGTVTSSPAGIACTAACSHAYVHGTSVTLTAAASATSKFAGWSGDCSGPGVCTLTMSANHSVTATFKALCIVPKLKGKTVKAAKKAIKRAHCSVGKVTKAFSAKVKKGRVISQKPKAGKKLAPGAKVKLKVSKGRL